MQRVVLNRKYVNLTVGRLCGIGLLPFVTDDVVDSMASPAPVGLFDLEVMPPAVDEHPRKQKPVFAWKDLDLIAPQAHFVSCVKLIVLLEVPDDIFITVRPQHSCHAGFLPGFMLPGVALSTLFGARIVESLRVRSARSRISRLGSETLGRFAFEEGFESRAWIAIGGLVDSAERSEERR